MIPSFLPPTPVFTCSNACEYIYMVVIYSYIIIRVPYQQLIMMHDCLHIICMRGWVGHARACTVAMPVSTVYMVLYIVIYSYTRTDNSIIIYNVYDTSSFIPAVDYDA